MSLSSARSYLRSRAETVGLKEWKDGFNFSNIPANIYDKAFHIESGQMVGVKNNQSDQEINFSQTVRIFVKGFRDPATGIDRAINLTEDYIKQCVAVSNRVTQQNGIKNVVFENASFDADSASNDNLVVASLTFRVFLILQT